MRIIGVAGTAKNTGKTTTISALLEGFSYLNNNVVGLTSIGYDGEEIDNVTGLLKPRLFLKRGSVVATAAACLRAGSAELEILETTDIMTPLGRISIAAVKSDGLAVVAGPNKSRELRRVLDRMTEKAGCDIILVDGALNRIAPMIETEGIILATGAARNPDVIELAEETGQICSIFKLPEAGKIYKQILGGFKTISVVNRDGTVEAIRYPALIHEDIIGALKAVLTEKACAIFIPAAVSQPVLNRLVDIFKNRLKGLTILLSDPIKLIIGGYPGDVMNTTKRIESFGGRIEVLKEVPVVAVTINPFYPRYRFETGVYEPGYVDEKFLREEIKKAVSLPVVNVLKDGPAELLKVLGFHKKG
ncbi:hypothetical protein [Thermosediminibacter litoriperuensis]|uniref:Uncharacterized protein n=1 Tax=Thermosediminibacter litoriperuensis TaxID=291989 RepID=A0A5S5AZG5_9FIRM|nr:hypothetical protein [Thermosediminibacter litoriperuensis]TYP59879.1 hypothetical protein LZ11_00039 [Thermosediminibacter litoriperuensis]